MSETALQVASSRQPIQAAPKSADLFKPNSFSEAMEFAKVLADGGMVPKQYVGKPAAIITTWQYGLELGVGLMQALQGISNINGNPAVFGDLGWALVQNHPDFVDSIEEITDAYAVCTLKRRGRSDKTWKYTMEMAKTAKLTGKDNWQNNPKRMLQWRARSWCMRDQFPDALKGMVIYEEAQDYIEGEPTRPVQAETKPSAPAELTEAEKAEKELDAEAGKEWGSAFYKAYSKSGYLPEESVKEIVRVCGEGIIKEVNGKRQIYSYQVPKRHTEALMKWAETPKDAAQDEPGSRE